LILWRKGKIHEVAIPAVYGQTRFDINVRSNRIKDFISVSDEAFARLILLAYHDQLKEDVLRRQVGDDKENLGTLSAGLYTNKEVSRSSRNAGWSIDGIKKYMELMEGVKQDRDSHPNMDNQYKEMQQRQPCKKRRLEPNIKMFEGDLSSDSEEEILECVGDVPAGRGANRRRLARRESNCSASDDEVYDEAITRTTAV
jgi:DNA-binding transcriptional MerR regulator